jgi:hypothetical protein
VTQHLSLLVVFFPARPDEHFANCRLTDPKPLRDLAIGMPLGFEPVHHLPPGISPSCASRRIASWLAKRSQSTLLISTLIATQGSGRIAEGASHIVLIGPALRIPVMNKVPAILVLVAPTVTSTFGRMPGLGIFNSYN